MLVNKILKQTMQCLHISNIHIVSGMTRQTYHDSVRIFHL